MKFAIKFCAVALLFFVGCKQAKKVNNLEIITIRMQGWQLETFKESYDYKVNNGISLFKKNLLEKNKL